MRRRLSGHLRQPLFRNAYALTLSSGLTSALGLMYWIVAARRYDPLVLGRNAALISALQTISTFGQLDTPSVLTRFLPALRQRATRLTAATYGASAAATLVLSVGFVVLVPHWIATFDFLGVGLSVVFCLGAVVWSLFVLQDGALTGLRRTTVVPVENSAYSMLKLGLLVGLAALLPSWGILASWLLPLALVVPAISVLVYRRYLPAHHRLPASSRQALPRRVLLRYVSFDYAGGICGALTTTALPVVVLGLLGADASATFYLAFLVIVMMNTLSLSLGASLVVEGSFDPERITHYARQVARRALMLLVPAVVVVELLAGMLLQLFGHRYAVAATPLLRFMALAIVPMAVLGLWAALVRLSGQVGRMLAVMVSVTIMLLASVMIGAHVDGLTGVGVAYAGTYLLTGAALIIPVRRQLRAPASPAALIHAAPPEPT
jgi:O-antigen/teichoic acid export membrane protein